MAINPIAYTERIARSFLKYQLTACPFADLRLHDQMRSLLKLDEVRHTPLLQGAFISLSRSFRQGPEAVLWTFDRLTSPNVGALVDSSHWGIIGYDVNRFLGTLGDRLWHVHLRDSAGPDTADRR